MSKAKLIVERLKKAQNKNLEKAEINREISRLPFEERVRIVEDLRIEKAQKDNTELIDVIDDIIQQHKPKG